MRILLAICLLAVSLFAQTKPLIMKHADSLSVSRKTGYMLLKGNVHFIHDKVQFKTMRASWNRNSDIVQCDEMFLFTHPDGYIKARSGVYQKAIDYASATGNVEAADSAKTYAFWGERLQYDRKNGVITVPTKPLLHYYTKDKEEKIDTITVIAGQIIYREKDEYAEAERNVKVTNSSRTYAFFGDKLQYDRKDSILKMPRNPILQQFTVDSKGKKDTITVKADSITFYQDREFAEAFGHVQIIQSTMTVTCDTGYLDKKNSWISMTGHPKCLLENHELSGDSIFMKLTPDSKNLESALVIRNAHGIQKEPPKGTKVGNHTEAFGDTLYAEFDGQKLKRLYVNLNAHGFFYEDDLPDYQNLMEGTRLDLTFEDGKMKLATISGSAQSTYFYVKPDRTVSGKNLASGDSITLSFDPKKNVVKKLKVRGASSPASGRYIDLERSRMRNMQKDSTKADSAQVEGSRADSAKAEFFKTDFTKEAVKDSSNKAGKAAESKADKKSARQNGFFQLKKMKAKEKEMRKKEATDGKSGTDNPN